MINTSSQVLHVNTSAGPSSSEITASKLIVAFLLLFNFLFGLAVNVLYLWVLKFKMKQSINNVWLFHLIITNLMFILLLPFLVSFVLLEPHWVFGTFLCKVFHSMISFCLYASVFLITGVSVNRYLLVCYPHWYIRRVTLHNVTRVCYLLFSLAFLCSFPYLLLRATAEKENVIVCYNDYTLSGRLESSEDQVKWGLFFFRILASFLIPSVVTTVCHFKILLKIKRDQRRSSTKPYKVIFLATVTFFACWAVYHVAYGLSLNRDRFEEGILLTLKIVSVCAYSMIGPVSYLFTMKNFTKEFQKFIHLFGLATS